MHYYKFNIGDYTSHTSHLDPLEDITYRRMLDWLYLHESPLPDSIDQIARLIRMRTHNECIEIVLREFFKLTDYGWIQENAMNEIDAYKEKSQKAKASAEARWAKKPIKPDANALRSECESNANHKPLTINQEPINKDKPDSLDWDSRFTNEMKSEIKICRKGKKITQRVINGFMREIKLSEEHGYTFKQCIEFWLEKQWLAPKFEYMKNDNSIRPENKIAISIFNQEQHKKQEASNSVQEAGSQSIRALMGR